jgi:hypothetical protein
MRTAMRVVTNTFVTNGRAKLVRPSGTKGAGVIGEDGFMRSTR